MRYSPDARLSSQPDILVVGVRNGGEVGKSVGVSVFCAVGVRVSFGKGDGVEKFNGVRSIGLKCQEICPTIWCINLCAGYKPNKQKSD